MVAQQLEASQSEQGNEIANVQAVGRGIEAAIEHDGAAAESLWQLDGISAIRQQPALLELIEDIHEAGSKRVTEGPLKVILRVRARDRRLGRARPA